MINLEVFLNGKPIAIDTLEKWNDVDTLFRTYLRVATFSQAPHVIPHLPPSEPETEDHVDLSNTTQIQTQHNSEPIKAPSTSVLQDYSVPITILRRSWPERAWLTINRASTGEEIYHAAIKLGYRSTATNPLGAFKRAIRSNPAFVQSGLNDTRAVLWSLKEVSGEKANEEVADASDNVPARNTIYGNNSPLIPPPGQQTGDYAEKALKRAGHGLSAKALVETMLADGWTTVSPTLQARERLINVALYKNKAKFEKRNGMWLLTAWRNNEKNLMSGFENATGNDAS